MKKTFSNIIYSCLSQGLALIVPLITSPYLARVLGADNLGIYSYMISVCTIFSTIGLIGLNSYGTREVAYVKNNIKERSKIFFELTILRAILLVISFVIFLTIYINTEYKIYSIIQLVWFIATFIDIVWFFSGVEEFKSVVISNTIIRILNLILVFILVKDNNDTAVYFIVTSGCTLLNIIILIPKLSKLIIVPEFRKLNLKRHLLPTLKIALPQMISYIYFQMDKVLLEAITNSTSLVAFYDQADKIVQVPVIAITAVGTVMLPRTAHVFKNNAIDELESIIKATVINSIFIILPMMFGVMVIINDMIPWYLGEEFIPVSKIVIFMSPIIFARALSSVSSNQYFIATDKTKQLTITYSISAILNIVIDIVTIPYLQCYGAVIGTVVAEFFVTFSQYYYMNKEIKLDWLLKIVIKYVIYSLLSMIPAILIGMVMEISILKTILQILSAAISYFVILFIAKDEQLKNIINILLENRRNN